MLAQPIRILHAILLTALILKPMTVSAETVAIPLFLNYPQLQLLMKRAMFTGPDDSALYLLDNEGCNTVSFSQPHLSAEGEGLRLTAKTHVTVGANVTDGCMTITRWAGRTLVKGKPLLVNRQPLSVQFQVQAVELYDQQGRVLSDSLLPQAYTAQLHQILSRFRMDLKPATDQLKALLPYVVPRYSADRLTRMIDSLRIGHVKVRPSGLDVRLILDVEKPPQSETEPALTAIEVQQLEQRCQAWDAFLTFVVKELAAATRLESLRSTLLDILLDVRYQIKFILTSTPKSGPDPVKQLFVRSWERLEPVMQEISIQLPEHNLLPFLSFITAADALKALDRLGPAAGLDISTDGLRRLARLLNDNPSIDPLKYPVEIDPALQQLFDFGIAPEIVPPKKPFSFKLQLIRPAFAASRWDRLNRWVPTTAELDPYLREIRDLLLQEADERLKSSSIAQEHARVFHHLMLATAWQESCWRQYILEKRKIVPLVSGTGDIGMLQINEKVWRGFYSPAKLRWDISYNVQAGSEILFKFMVNYALKRHEHKKDGGLANLARATYSAYNGGPSQVGRYRSKNVPTAHKKIDTAFYSKYKQISRGNEFAVAQCLGGDDPGPAAAPQIGKKSESKPVAAAGKSPQIENIAWIKKRNSTHFTLQLAAVSSEQAVKDLIKKHTRPGIFSYYRRKHQGRELYIAIYGSFSNRADAEKAAAHFAPLKPWIRDFGSIQAIMSK
jgi:septal ring-binding cell division protein DamX